MRHFLIAAAACALALPSAGAMADPPATLTRDGPIARWDEAMPLGNGLLGGLVWGEGNVVRISLDRADLWDARTPEMLERADWTYDTMKRLKEAGDHAKHVEMFDAPYDTMPYPTKLPAGRIELVFPAGVEVKGFRLDVERAEATVDAGAAKITAFFDAKEQVAMIRVTGPAPAVRVLRPKGLDTLGYKEATFDYQNPDVEGIRLRTMVQDAALGLTYAVVVGEKRYGETTTLAVTVARTPPLLYDGPTAETIGRVLVWSAMRAGYDARFENHDRWWKDFWAISSVTIPDASLQKHYNLVKYFYGAASREGAPPIPLQGVWTADEGGLPPWKGDYHNDLNTQMTYLAVHAAGLVDAEKSWLDFNWNLLPAYRKFAQKFYGLGGRPGAAVIPGVMTIEGAPMGGWGQYSLSPTHGAWVAQSFYLHWKYTGDERFMLEKAYPFCAAVGNALFEIAKEDGEGRIRLPLSSSPEIYDNSPKAWLPPNSNYDLAMMRFICQACSETAGGMEESMRWNFAPMRLEDFDTDPATGSLTFARGFPYNESHRHFSHAMAIHPLGLITIEGTDADRRTIAATLDQIEKMGTSQWCGYSFSWFSAMNARAGRPEKALEYLTKYLSFTGPNGFHLNGDQSGTGLSNFSYRPFTLEGNFLAMDAVQEMLIQSWGGVVRVFPAVSEKWADSSFRDLRAEGGWRVSAERRAGRTVRVTVAAGPGGALRLRDPFPGREAKWSRKVERDGKDVVARLTPGETLTGECE